MSKGEFTIWRLERDFADIRQGSIEFPVKIEILSTGRYNICFPANIHIIGNNTYHKLVNTIITEHKMKFRGQNK